MSIRVLEADELGQALACGVLAMRSRAADHGALLPAVNGVAQALSRAAAANRKSYALRYGEIPEAAPSANAIMQAAKPVLRRALHEPEMCAPYAGGTPVSGILYNVEGRHLGAADTQVLEQLHNAIAAWNPENVALAGKRERAQRLEQTASGRYPWKELHRDTSGAEYERDIPGGSFTKALASALREATGRTWSVTKNPGSSYVKADAPPARRTCEWDGVTPAPKGQGYACLNDREVLGTVLHEPGGKAHPQGVSISPDPGCRERVYDLVRGRSDPAECRWDRDR